MCLSEQWTQTSEEFIRTYFSQATRTKRKMDQNFELSGLSYQSLSLDKWPLGPSVDRAPKMSEGDGCKALEKAIGAVQNQFYCASKRDIGLHSGTYQGLFENPVIMLY